MRSLLSVRTVLIPVSMAVVVGSLPVARSGGKAASAQDRKPAAVSTTKPHAEATHLRLEVSGLTRDNAERIRTTLGAARTTDHACVHCNVHEPAAGKCPKCGAQLQDQEELLLGAVTPMADTGTLWVTLSIQHPTRLSDLQGALEASALALRTDELVLTGHPQVLVAGGTAASTGAVEAALEEAQVFDHPRVHWSATSKTLVIDGRPTTEPPTHAAIQRILQPLQLRIEDVVWEPPTVKG